MGTCESNNAMEINEPFETLWVDYEFKDPTLAELVLYRMLVRHNGVPFSAFYKNKNSDTFYLWRIDYQKFIEMGSSFAGTLYAITKEEMNRLLDGEEIDTVYKFINNSNVALKTDFDIAIFDRVIKSITRVIYNLFIYICNNNLTEGIMQMYNINLEEDVIKNGYLWLCKCK